MNTFWEKTSELSIIAEKLEEKIPVYGEVDNKKQNPALEKFRKAANVYYEIFNNGGMNSLAGCKNLFGLSAAEVRRFVEFRRWDRLHDKIEPKLTEIVLAAAAEQLSK